MSKIKILELPDNSRIADWIELQVLYTGKPLSKSKIISLVGDGVDETDIDSAIQELIRRLHLYGKKKPFKIEGTVISPILKWEDCPELIFCLYFSTYGAADSDKGTKLFEQFSKNCVEQFFKMKTILLGFPSTHSLKKQIDELAKTCCEKRGDDPLPSDKDRGADVIAYTTFDDDRNSNIIFIMQCGAGFHWATKKPVPIPSWLRYIRWSKETVIPGIAITQIIDASKWQNTVDDYGIVIDRARFFRTITSKGFKINVSLRNQIIDWCKNKIA